MWIKKLIKEKNEEEKEIGNSPRRYYLLNEKHWFVGYSWLSCNGHIASKKEIKKFKKCYKRLFLITG